MKWTAIAAKHKLLSVVLAGTLTVGTFFGGTFAWQSINHAATNETDGAINPGGRLHDDFNGRNKDVYVENFSHEKDGGLPIFARVRLYEYMETGADAGKNFKDDTGNPVPIGNRNVTVLNKTDADVNEPRTWILRLPNPSGTAVEGTSLRQYWQWKTGGETIYMPTFNKDKSSTEPDLNGTLAGPDGVVGANPDQNDVDDRYKDYAEYALGDTKEDTATYQDNTNKTETHTAKQTASATVMSMAEWKQQGSNPGPYWVYDTDGWVYWAQPIEPESDDAPDRKTATGLLLDGIEPTSPPDDDWYYAITVIGQFATAGDWGDKDAQTGFYTDGDSITDDGLALLKKISNTETKIQTITMKDGIVYVKAGATMDLKDYVNLDILNATGNKAETALRWEADDTQALTALMDGVFAPRKDMAGKKYTMKATSAFDTSKETTVQVLVYPADATGVVQGADNNMYVNYGDNTFQKILETEQNDSYISGQFISAGVDHTIGNGNDRPVITLDRPMGTYGTKFIDLGGGFYQAAGPNGKLDDAEGDDIRLYSPKWPPETLSDILADSVKVTGPSVMKIDKPEVFTAEVLLQGTKITDQEVTWEVRNNTSKDTYINENGLLYIAADEKHENLLTVVATSKTDPKAWGQQQVTVKPWGWEDLDEVPPLSDRTVTIDGLRWYVVAKDDGKALIWAKYDSVTGTGGINGVNGITAACSAAWDTNNGVRNNLDKWLEEKTTKLKEVAVPTKILTRRGISNVWYETEDRIFLPTLADLTGKTVGTNNNMADTTDARNFTYGGKRLIPSNDHFMLRADTARMPLRTASGAGSCLLFYYPNGGINQISPPTYAPDHRPMMWVKMPSHADYAGGQDTP